MPRQTERVSCYHCDRSFVRVTTGTAADGTPECRKCRNTLHEEVLRFVGRTSFRYESTIINRILAWKDTYWVARVEDVLFELVQAGKLEWFGAEDAAYCRPDRRPTKYTGILKYRLKKAKNGNK